MQGALTEHQARQALAAYLPPGNESPAHSAAEAVRAAEAIKPLVPAGVPMSQMALRWCLDFDAVSVIIPGAKNPGQARANAADALARAEKLVAEAGK